MSWLVQGRSSVLRPAGIRYSVQAVGQRFPLSKLHSIPRRRSLHCCSHKLASTALPLIPHQRECLLPRGLHHADSQSDPASSTAANTPPSACMALRCLRTASGSPLRGNGWRDADCRRQINSPHAGKVTEKQNQRLGFWRAAHHVPGCLCQCRARMSRIRRKGVILSTTPASSISPELPSRSVKLVSAPPEM